MKYLVSAQAQTLFVAGGEYGTGEKTGEVYDPLCNTWLMTPVSGQSFSDSNRNFRRK